MSRAAETFLTLSPPLARMAQLPAMLGGPVRLGAFGQGTFLAWGDRWPSRLARRWAALAGRPVLHLEDGLIRSAGLGKAGAPCYAILIDRQGPHFDARAATELEAAIHAGAAMDQQAQSRIDALLETIRQNRLDKYNLPRRTVRIALQDRIILVDQVAGDRSVAGSGADARTFLRMLDDAVAGHGRSAVLVKTHPDVMAGLAEGYLASAAQARGIDVTAEPFAIDDLAGVVQAVWTVCSTMGFEALIRKLPVVTYGMPFYAGWGLTEDRAEGPVAAAARQRRNVARDLRIVAGAALVGQTRYADPETGEALTAEMALARLAARRRGGAPGPAAKSMSG